MISIWSNFCIAMRTIKRNTRKTHAPHSPIELRCSGLSIRFPIWIQWAWQMNVMGGANRERKRRFWCVRIPIAFVLPFQTWESDGYMKAAVEVDSICTQLPAHMNFWHTTGPALTWKNRILVCTRGEINLSDKATIEKRRRVSKSNGEVQSSSMRTTPFIQHQRCLELISAILNPGSRSGILWIHKLSN